MIQLSDASGSEHGQARETPFHDRQAPAEGIAFEFMAARPGTRYPIEEVMEAVGDVRRGRLPFAR